MRSTYRVERKYLELKGVGKGNNRYKNSRAKKQVRNALEGAQRRFSNLKVLQLELTVHAVTQFFDVLDNPSKAHSFKLIPMA